MQVEFITIYYVNLLFHTQAANLVLQNINNYYYTYSTLIPTIKLALHTKMDLFNTVYKILSQNYCYIDIELINANYN